MSLYKIVKASDPDALAKKASQTIASYIRISLDERNRSQIALSGGSTPSATYKLLRHEHISWSRVDVFLGDERWVEPTDPSSNALMLNSTLLSSGHGSEAVFHPVPTSQFSNSPDCAQQYSKLIEETCIGQPPIFDLILLGLGEDGHTASLFPGTDSLYVKNKWTAVGKGKGMDRITLTSPVLSAARKVIFLISGESKQLALKRLLDLDESFERTPAKLVRPRSEILLLVDEAAAALI